MQSEISGSTRTSHQEAELDDSHGSHHIVSPMVYGAVLLALLVLTVVTVWVAYVDLGAVWNLILALGIATVKASLVVLFFMHVLYSGRLVQVTIIVSMIFFGLLIAGTMMDVKTRYNVVLVDQTTSGEPMGNPHP